MYLATVVCEIEIPSFINSPLNAGSTPTRVGETHSPDEVPDLPGYRWTTLIMAALPSLIESEALSKPGNRRLWLEDDEGRTPVSPQPGKPNPQEAVSHAQTDTMAAVRAPQEGYQHAEVPGFGGKLRGSKTLRRKGQPWFRQPHAAGKFRRFNKNNFSW